MGLEGPLLAGKNRSRSALGVLHDLVNHISKYVEVHVKDHDGDGDDDDDDEDEDEDEDDDDDVDNGEDADGNERESGGVEQNDEH